MLGWMKHKLESRLPGEISITSRYADNITLMAESEEELKSLLMKVKEETEIVGLKLNIRTTKIMASNSITSCQIDGETMKTVTDFLGGRCSRISGGTPEARTLPTKVRLVKAMVFPVVMCGCESWAIKKAECQRIDA